MIITIPVNIKILHLEGEVEVEEGDPILVDNVHLVYIEKERDQKVEFFYYNC
jgi:hypothetical protein